MVKHILMILITLLRDKSIPQHNAYSNVHILILGGELIITLDGKDITVKKGDVVAVGFQKPISIATKDKRDAHFAIIKTPNVCQNNECNWNSYPAYFNKCDVPACTYTIDSALNVSKSFSRDSFWYPSLRSSSDFYSLYTQFVFLIVNKYIQDQQHKEAHDWLNTLAYSCLDQERLEKNNEQYTSPSVCDNYHSLKLQCYYNSRQYVKAILYSLALIRDNNNQYAKHTLLLASKAFHNTTFASLGKHLLAINGFHNDEPADKAYTKSLMRGYDRHAESLDLSIHTEHSLGGILKPTKYDRSSYISSIYKIESGIADLEEEIFCRSNAVALLIDPTRPINVTDLSDYVFCPASYAIKKSFELFRNKYTSDGIVLHEEKLASRLTPKKARMAWTEYIRKKDTMILSELFPSDIYAKLADMIADINKSEIIYYGHEDKKIYKKADNTLIGKPDYVLRRGGGKYFVIEDKFTQWKRYSATIESKQEPQKAYDNHIIQLAAYLSKFEDIQGNDGYIIYWQYDYDSNGLVIKDVDIHHIIVSEDEIRQLNKVIENVNVLLSGGTTLFNITNDQYYKCAGCSSRYLCIHKTQAIKEVRIPYPSPDPSSIIEDYKVAVVTAQGGIFAEDYKKITEQIKEPLQETKATVSMQGKIFTDYKQALAY